MRKFILVLTLAVATVAVAQNPFVGTWKLNPAKGHYTGSTFSYTETTPGHYLFQSGSAKYEFNMDGKDYPMIVPNATNSWQPAGPNRWHQVQKIDGKVTGQTDTVISEDGSTMTDTGSGVAEDGTTAQGTTTYQRVSGGPGLAGTWKIADAKFQGDFPLVISEPSADSMRLEYTHDKFTETGPTDGHTPWKFTSPHPDADRHFGFTMSRNGSRTLTYSTLLDGKEVGRGEMTVSDDGRMLTDTSWDVKVPDQKTISVYEKE